MKKDSQNQKISAEKFFSDYRIQIGDDLHLDEKFANSLGQKLASLHLDNISHKTMSKQKPMLGTALLFGGGGAFLAIAAVFLLLNVFGVIKFPAINRTLGSELAYTEGSVEYKTDAGWMDASEGLVLSQGNSLRVLGEGKAILNLDDGSVVRLDNETTITLASLDSNNIQILNEKGVVYTRVAKLDRDFDVVVEDSTYRSLGTAYKTINMDGKKGVRVYESAVEVIIKDQSGVRVEQGKKYFEIDESDKDNEKMVVLMTEDEIKKDNFAQWNKEEDKKIDEYKNKLGVLETTEENLPYLEILSPGLSFETTDEKVVVKGKVDLESILSVGEVENVEHDETFEIVVDVPIGNSQIIIKASKDGVENVLKIDVTRNNPDDENTDPKPVTKISASGSKTDSGIKVSWGTEGVDVSKGFKVAYSTTDNTPTYPENSAQYVDGGARSTVLSLKDGKTYYIRVCQYNGSGCGIISNTVTVTAPTKVVPTPTEGVNKITLLSNGNGNFSWKVDGYSESGYKLVWSKNSGPTYPNRSGDYYNYYSNPSTMSGSISAKDGDGTYFVRVCEYLGGSCGMYSNEVSVELAGGEEGGVNSISLRSNGGGSFSWTVDGYSESGYKLVWSKNTSPTYPCREGDKYIYNSDPAQTSATVNAFDGSGTYYVRVCEYLGGSCGVYSNQLTVEL